jgi:hypothetical protein
VKTLVLVLTCLLFALFAALEAKLSKKETVIIVRQAIVGFFVGGLCWYYVLKDAITHTFFSR